MANVVYMAKDGKTGKLSEVKSWTAETTEKTSNCRVDKITTHSGSFEPGTKAKVAEKMRLKNKGKAGAKCNLKFGANTGNGWSTICNIKSQLKAPSGGCCYWNGHQPEKDYPCRAPSFVCAEDKCGSTVGNVLYNMPDEHGKTVHFAIKVWGTDESEPGWPSLAMIRGRKTKSELTGNQKVAIAGAAGAVVGGLVGYATGRR